MRKVSEIIYTQAKQQFSKERQNVIHNTLEKIGKEKNESSSFAEVLALYVK